MPKADMDLRILLSTVLAECGKPRDEVAARMTKALGRPINASILNDYTVRNGAGARFPAAYVSAFCEATGDDRIRKFLLSPRMQAVINLGRNTLDAVRESRGEVTAILDEEIQKGRRVRL